MSTSEKYMQMFQAAAQELTSPAVEMARKVEVATHIKEQMEAVHAGEYSNFLKVLLAPLCEVLTVIPPEHSDGEKHRLRNAVLQLLHRLPSNDHLKPHAGSILTVCLKTLESDNEENGIVAVHMLFDIHKNFRPDLASFAEQFLGRVTEMYKAFIQNAGYYFGDHASSFRPEMLRPESIPAVRSFQIVVETPLIIMFLSQVYKQALASHLQNLVPLMIQAATCNPELPQDANPALSKIMGDLKWAQVKTIQFLTYLFKDFSALMLESKQAICDSMARLLKTAPDTHTVRKELLITTRHMIQSKDLQDGFFGHLSVFLDDSNLVGRQGATTEALRPLAYSLLAELVHHMRESLTADQLARVIHLFCCLLHDPSLPPTIETTTVRLLLNLVQTIYHRRSTASPEDRLIGRQLLLKILSCYATKLPAMAAAAPKLLAEVRKERARRNAVRDKLLEGSSHAGGGEDDAEMRSKDGDDTSTTPRDGDKEKEKEKDTEGADRRESRELKKNASGMDLMEQEDGEKKNKKEGGEEEEAEVEEHVLLHTLPQNDKLRELADRKHLLYTLLGCLKTVLFGVAHYDRNQRQGEESGSMQGHQSSAADVKGLTPEETRLVSRVILSGMEACSLYWETEVRPDPQGVYYRLADMLSVLERQELHMCLVPHMGAFVQLLTKSDHLLHIVVHLLMSDSSNTAQAFTDALAGFLINEKMDALEDVQSREGALILRLYQMIFGALTKHPAQLRTALQPRLADLVINAVRRLCKSSNPKGHAQVLRACFRALHSGRTTPALQPMFDVFKTVLEPTITLLLVCLRGPSQALPKSTLAELLLMLPANLSDQLSHLKKLVWPLVVALESQEDQIISLGLKTLEFWIDNLNPEFLEMTLAEHFVPILSTLWGHLCPGHIGFSAKALQILGKLGGRSRRLSRELKDFVYKEHPEHGMRIILTFEPSTPFLVPVDKCVTFARQAVRNDPLPLVVTSTGERSALSSRKPPDRSLGARVRAFEFLRATLLRIANVRTPSECPIVGTAEEKLKEALFGQHEYPRAAPQPMGSKGPYPKARVQAEAEQAVLAVALAGCLEAAADKALIAEDKAMRAAARKRKAEAAAARAAKAAKEAAARGDEGAPVPASATGEGLGGDVDMDAASAEANGDGTSAVVKEETGGAGADSRGGGGADAKGEKEEEDEAEEEEDGESPIVSFTMGIVRHFALLMAAGGTTTEVPKEEEMESFSSASYRKPRKVLTPAVVVDVLCELLSDTVEKKEVALRALKMMVETILVVVAEQHRCQKPVPLHLDTVVDEGNYGFPAALADIVTRVTHLCFSTEPQKYMGGLEATCLILQEIPSNFSEVFLVTALRGIMSVFEKVHTGTAVEAQAIRTSTEAVSRAIGVPLVLTQLLTEADAIPRGMEGAKEDDKEQGKSDEDVDMEEGSKAELALTGPALESLVKYLSTVVFPGTLGLSLFTDLPHRFASSLLRTLANASAVSVDELLRKCSAIRGPSEQRPDKVSHVMDRVVLPLKMRPLRAYAGTMNALSFALSCDPPLLADAADEEAEEKQGGGAEAPAEGRRQWHQAADFFEETVSLVETGFDHLVQPYQADPQTPRSIARARNAALRLMGVVAGLKPHERVQPILNRLNAEPKDGKPHTLYHRMVTVLLRALTSVKPFDVAEARRAMENINRSELPKTVIQHALEPVLTAMASHQSLSLPLLRGMSHILDLLAEWFEPSQLTQKLLDHLESWLDPKALFALEKAWAAGDEALIPAAILHLFHKLPSVTGSVASYLESSDKRLGLVVVSIHLETALLGSPGLHTPGTSYPTPFRLPLALFLAAHAPESIAYFLTPKRFVSAAYFHLLIDVLLSPAGAPLVAELKAHPERILEAGGIAPGSAPNTSPEGMELAVRALELIKTLIQLDPSWVSSHETLRTALLERWHAQDALAPSQPPHLRGEGLETSFLLVCLMALLRESIQPDLLLSLVAPLRKRLEVEVTPLKAFLAQEIPEKATSDEVASILEEVTTRLVEIYSSQEIRTGEPPSEEGRVRQLDVALALQYIVRPCLLAHAKKGTVRECLHDPIFSSLLDTVLERSPEDAKEDGEERRVQANVVPELAEQIMQLTIVLMQQCPDELHGKGRDYRRGLIRVPWHYLKNETSPVRYTAFMMVCQFMKHMACPEKIYLQVYTALLKVWQPEGRKLIQEALDVLVPLLPMRLAQAPEVKYPMWIRWTKRSLMEEGHSMGNLVHILQLISRHHKLFAPWRNQLAHLIVQALQRLAMPTNSPLENRKLAIDLIAVVLDWEEWSRAQSEASPGTPTAAVGSKRPADDAGGAADEQPPAQRVKTESGSAPAGPSGPADASRAMPQVQYVVNFCQRMALMIVPLHQDSNNAGKVVRVEKDLLAMHAHTLTQFSRALALWPDTPVKFGNVLEKFLANDLNRRIDPPMGLITGLEIVSRVLRVQGVTSLSAMFDQTALLFRHALNTTNDRACPLLITVLQDMLKSCDISSPDGLPKEVRDLMEVLQREMHRTIQATQDSFSAYIEKLQDIGRHPRDSNESKQALQEAQTAAKALEISIRSCCGVMRVVEALSEHSMEFVEPFLTPVVKLINTIAREHIRPFMEERVQPMRLLHGDTKNPERNTQPEYGTAIWLMVKVLRIARRRVLPAQHADRKKLYVHTMVLLISDNNRSAHHVHPAILLELLDAVRFWIDREEPEAGELSVKEVVGSLQRLASLDRNQCIHESILPQWEANFLGLLHRVCTTPEGSSPDAALLCADTFSKVERVFLCGLKARDEQMRLKFFKLYTAAIPRNVFSRLRFVVEQQDWEAVSGTFWLQHGITLHLDLIKGAETFFPAPNSGQAAPLLPGTPSLVFAQAGRRPHRKPAEKGKEKEREEGPSKEEEGKKKAEEGQGANTGQEENGGVGDKGEEGTAGEGEEQKEGEVKKEAGEQAGEKREEKKDEGEETERSKSSPPPPPIPQNGPPIDSLGEEARGLIRKHTAFMERNGKVMVSQVVEPLAAMVHEDTNLAYHLWVLIFPIVWAALDKNQQFDLAKPIIGLLSKEYHNRQSAARPNVVQALLEGISLSMPQPKIPAELFRFLGRTFNAWHISATLLESHILLFPDESRCISAATDLYRSLEEWDWLAGLWKQRCQSLATRAALSLTQLGLWEDAQAVLWNAVDKYNKGEMKGSHIGKGELSLWVEQWLECCRNLNQWDSVMEYGKTVDHQGALLDILWKINSWKELQETVMPRLSVSDTPGALIIEGQMHLLHTGDFTRADNRMTHALHTALFKWWSLPELGLDSHTPLLRDFQRLVEVIESKEALTHLRDMQQREVPPSIVQEVADLQATWKLRTPNEWEPLTHWADLLVWRNHCYHLMITSHYASPANQEAMTQNGFTDKAWSVNRLASIARKHGAYASCVDIINSLYGFDTMQVQEAFVKIREQAKAQMADPTQIPHAFTLLNDSNLSYFPAHQQAELLRLKGLCLERIGHDDDANDAFALALSLHDRLPEAWLSWGSFCESAGVRQGKPQEQYLEQAVSCYLTAASHGTQAARAMLVRALALLSGEDVNGAVLKAFDAHGGSVPTVAWVPLTPQIVAGLQHHEAPIMRALCKRLVVAHPQHTYLHLRALLLGLRSVVNKPEIEGLLGKYINNSNGVADLVTAFEEGKKIMHWLRQDNTHEVTLLEVIIHEMTHSLAPRPEERLFAVVQTLLQRCHRVRFRDDSDVPAAIQADFVGVIRACFHREGSSSSLARYEQAFNRDLSPNSPSAPKTLGELIMRLKAWRHFLEQTVEAICPGKLLIEEEAPKLLELCYVGLEMPGHVPSGGQGDASGVYVERFGGDVDVVRRGGNSFRRVQIWGTDGVVRHLLLQTFATSNAAAGDDRIVQLLHVLNKQLEHLPQARRRRLSFLAPVSVPLHHNMRLIEDCPSMSMYGDPYTIYCERNGQDPDLAITQFKRICLAKSGEIANFDPPMRPFVSFKQIIGAISDNIFAQFIYKTIPSPTMLFHFKKRFCSQMGLHALLCYVMSLGGRTPARILFSRATGDVLMSDFFPQYNASTKLAGHSETVPFRLTRNLHTFFTIFGVEGIYITAMTLAAVAALQPHSNVLDFLHLLFRDDLTANQVDLACRQLRRQDDADDDSAGLLPGQALTGVIRSNTEQVQTRLSSIAPTPLLHILQGQQGSAPRKNAEYIFAERGVSGEDVMDRAKKLAMIATDLKKLALMDLSWHPWF